MKGNVSFTLPVGIRRVERPGGAAAKVPDVGSMQLPTARSEYGQRTRERQLLSTEGGGEGLGREGCFYASDPGVL